MRVRLNDDVFTRGRHSRMTTKDFRSTPAAAPRRHRVNINTLRGGPARARQFTRLVIIIFHTR